MTEKLTHILLVEDDKFYAETIRKTFATQNFPVNLTAVETLSEARNFLSRSMPDLMILDLLLPDGSGLELISGEKQDLLFPVVVLTYHGDEPKAVSALKKGAIDYIVKSEDPQLGLPQIIQKNLVLWDQIIKRKQALQDSEAKFRQLAENIDEVFWMEDLAGKEIVYISPAFEKVWGLKCEDLLKNPQLWMESIHPEDRGKILDLDLYRNRVQLIEGQFQSEFRIVRPDGSVRWIRDRAFPVQDEKGEVIRIAGISEDITPSKLAGEEIKQLAFYDPLTQLANRRLLHEWLKHGIDVVKRNGSQMALLMLDLDHFKAVNDSLGHQAGDELLQQVASRMTAMLRNVDMVARMGGDEFAIILEDISHVDAAARVAEKIIIELNKPFKLTQSNDVRIGASIGISLSPQHGDSPEILMDHADAALYQAKDMGRGCFTYFSEDISRSIRDRIAQEVKLRNAIEQQELCLFYQPQVDLDSGRIIGAEALVRWNDPIEGLISPIHFIPIAEETSLIMEIGEWVLRETCKQGRQWLDMGLPSLNLAVNVSPHQFLRSNITTLVAEVLAETGFPAKQLELEITESGLMKNQDNSIDILNNLRTQGICLAIDDFGTGYSSLAYLKRFPLDALKIDKSFIDEIPHNKDDMEIAATILTMGHTLGFKVIAEGVETQEQLAFLRKNNCDTYQGFIKSHPIPAEEFAELVRAQQRGD